MSGLAMGFRQVKLRSWQACRLQEAASTSCTPCCTCPRAATPLVRGQPTLQPSPAQHSLTFPPPNSASSWLKRLGKNYCLESLRTDSLSCPLCILQILRKLRGLALDTEAELEKQNEALDSITTAVDQTTLTIHKHDRRMKKLA